MTRQTAQNLNLLSDCAILVGASAIACSLPGQPHWHWMVFLGMSAGSMLLWTLGGRLLRHYDVWNGRGIAGDVALTALLLSSVLIAMGVLRWFVPAYAAGSHLARFALLAVPAILWLRLMTSWLVHREQPVQPVLIMGIGPLGRHTGLGIHEQQDHRRVIGYLGFSDEPSHDRLPAELMGSANDLESVLKKEVVGEVFIAGNGDSQRAEMQDAIRVLERFGIPFALPACGFRFGRARPEHESVIADGYIHYVSVRHKPVQLAIKRLIDIAASATALFFLSPIMIAVALTVKLSSRGPTLFKQVRVGRHARPFNMLKFRSMVVNAEELKAKLIARNEQSGPVFKMTRDPRITPVGRFIRKYSIDELPQLINVLRGEMSLVGPRPPVPSEVSKYEAWQRRR